MHPLNLPPFPFQIVEGEDKKIRIFDPNRKKFLLLTSEEWVRQHCIQYLLKEKNFPASLLIVEGGIAFSQRKGRFDILFYSPLRKPLLLVECKAPSVKITQQTFDQIARYNMNLKVSYLVVTNGLEHYACQIDFETKSYTFLPEIPDYKNIALQ